MKHPLVCVFLISPLSSSPDATRNEIRFLQFHFSSINRSTIVRSYRGFRYSIPLYLSRDLTTAIRETRRFSLRAGSRFFFFFFAYLPKVSDRFSFSSSSTSFREIGAFLLSLANSRGNRIALSPCGGGKGEGEDRTFPPGYDVSSQHLAREKKASCAKGHRVPRRKKRVKEGSDDHRSRFESGL